MGRCVAVLVLAVACGDDAARSDAGRDAGRDAGIDAGPLDAGFDASADAGIDGGFDGGPPCAPPVLPPLALALVAGGHLFRRPVFVAQPPGEPNTLWVVERTGAIQRVTDDALEGVVLTVPDLVISDVAGDERGLLSLGFHPDYAENGLFYVVYTRRSVPTYWVLAEYEDDGDPTTEPVQRRRLYDYPHPDFNHHGSMLSFGPDGYLYVSVGDGGAACDRRMNYAQRLDMIFGKMLRLDVTREVGDLGAPGNPFAGVEGALPEIWSYGLRNPWRTSIDRRTGDIYIGDVGQRQYEEINIQPGRSTGGENYGWRYWEGVTRSSISSECDDTGFDAIAHREPDVVIDQDLPGEALERACAIIGGYVYRGSAIPELDGVYLFGDYCSTHIAALRYCDGAVMGLQRAMDLTGITRGLASFGEDLAGELYLVFIDGSVHKLVRGP